VTGGIITPDSTVLAGTFAALVRKKAVEVTEVGIVVVPGVLPAPPGRRPKGGDGA
jgi:hypothetical protein